MIVTILVTDLKLRETLTSKFFFILIEHIQFSDSMRTFSVAAFINRYFISFFPGKEGRKTIRTKVFYFFTEAFMKLKESRANFAFQL